jgi:hypothetical protein
MGDEAMDAIITRSVLVYVVHLKRHFALIGRDAERTSAC